MLEVQRELAQPAQHRSTLVGTPRRRGRPTRALLKLEAQEAQIRSLEQSLEQVSDELQRAGSDVGRVRDLGLRYAQLETELQAALGDWERLAAELEEV